MRELDPLVGAYVHLSTLPREKEALRELQKIASLVKPIMRNRGWRVGTLTEFWPEQKNLLGLNVNRGQKICLRLRYPGDKTQFLPLDSCVDTMLHELCHNLIGPHDESFNKLWNELRDEYTDLKIKGYTGEGFLTEGNRLGGARLSENELRRQRRLAAEKRNNMQKASGQKLGGRPVLRNINIREVITDAVQRRQTITQGCASGTQGSEQIANEATRNGFRTQAEEDQANDRAIAEALWELAQQDESNQEPEDPKRWKSEGLEWDPKNGLGVAAPHKRSQSAMDQPTQGSWLATWESPKLEQSAPSSACTSPVPPAVKRLNASAGTPRPDSETLGDSPFTTPPQPASKSKPKVFMPEKPTRRPPPIQEHPAFRHSSSSNGSSNHSTAPSVSSVASSNPNIHSPHPSAFMSPIEGRLERASLAAPTPVTAHAPVPAIKIDTSWTCPACTLVNPSDYLCCEACMNPRPCLGTIDDFSMMDMGPDALPTESPMSPQEMPGSDFFRAGSGSSTSTLRQSEVSNRLSSRPTSMPPAPLNPALKTARSLAAATKNAKPVQEKKIGWKCNCGAFMEDIWWICSACGKMKESS